MGIILQTIEEYAIQSKQEITFWVSFNKAYNAFHFQKTNESLFDVLDKEKTDYKAQEKFLEFVKQELPNIKLTPVFDLVPTGFIEFPYLGSYALNVKQDSPEYKKITQKYEDENGNPKSLSCAIFGISLELAQKMHKEKEDFFNEEF